MRRFSRGVISQLITSKSRFDNNDCYNMFYGPGIRSDISFPWKVFHACRRMGPHVDGQLCPERGPALLFTLHEAAGLHPKLWFTMQTHPFHTRLNSHLKSQDFFWLVLFHDCTFPHKRKSG